ncbi:MAG: hypothetical protein QOF92_1930, partial [Pseudonocardiales bacterium]|nr:hypothetical protein [Pseudonocardiales bacterium]
QPLHFIATVIAGSPTLDLIGWSLTGIGLAFVARALLAEPTLTRPTVRRDALPIGDYR